MDTNFLKSFITVAELGSIAEAARHLNLTASAVAQRVRALEDEIGVPLLLRAGRTVQPTAAGASLLPEARRIVSAVSGLRGLANEGLVAGNFRLGVFTSALTGVVPDILVALLRDLPLVDIYVQRAISLELYPKVLSGELDAAFVLRPNFEFPKSVEWLPLRREPLIALVPEEETSDDINDLINRYGFVRFDRNNWGGRLASQYLEANGLRPNERIELDSLEAIAILVSKGLGVSIVPEWAPPLPQGVRLRRVVLDEGEYAREIGIIWLRSSPKIAISRRLSDQALKWAREKARA